MFFMADRRMHTSSVPESSLNHARRDLNEALFAAVEELPRVPKQARSRSKRDDLLKAAARLFVERGYATTIADDISATAGVSVGTFYNYFRNKRQILLVLVLDRLETIFSQLEVAQIDFTSENHRDGIFQAIATVMSPNEETGLRRVWMELVSVDPELEPYQQLIRQYAQSQLEEHIEHAVAAGVTWPDLDVPATALAIFTMLDALSLRRTVTISDERITASITDMSYRTIFLPREAGDGQL